MAGTKTSLRHLNKLKKVFKGTLLDKCDKHQSGEKKMNTKINAPFEEHTTTMKSQINQYTIQADEWNNDD